MPNHLNHMYLVYIDESYDETNFAYSAIFINAFRWNDYFNQLLEWRGEWKEKADVGQPSPAHFIILGKRSIYIIIYIGNPL